MITNADLRKAPFKTSWILNEQNIHSKTFRSGVPSIVWKSKNSLRLWSYNHCLYLIRENRIFDMNNHYCGFRDGPNVFGPKLGDLVNVFATEL
jgi:hypothetical protein